MQLLRQKAASAPSKRSALSSRWSCVTPFIGQLASGCTIATWFAIFGPDTDRCQVSGR